MDRIDTLTPAAAPALPRSYTHQLLTAIADELDADQPFLVLTPRVLGEAMTTAMHLILDGLPEPIRDAALAGAMGAGITPRHKETAGEHALRLRAAARGL